MLKCASAIAVAVALLVPPAVDAQPRRPQAALEAEGRRLVQRWRQTLATVDKHLVEGRADKAYRMVTRLLDDMTERLASGESVAVLLSTALVLRAIAAVKIGEPDEGVWHWQVAQQLFPRVKSYRTTAYGDTWSFLKAHPVREPEATTLEDKMTAMRVGLEPPRKLRAPKPDFPSARRGIDAVAIVVEVLVGKDGRVREPRVQESHGELTLLCETLDTLRRWEFEPARLAGEPVEATYVLTVNFASSRRP